MNSTEVPNTRYDIIEAIGQIAREKNVNRELVIETIKTGLLSAAKKRFGNSDHVTVDIDINTGSIILNAEWEVVETVEDPSIQISLEDAKRIDPKAKIGKTVIELLKFEDFGRHAIHSAKQSLIQKVREIERCLLYTSPSPRDATLSRMPSSA